MTTTDILLFLIGLTLYLAAGIWASVAHFEKFGIRSGLAILVWPAIYTGLVMALLIVILETSVTYIKSIVHNFRNKWRKKK